MWEKLEKHETYDKRIPHRVFQLSATTNEIRMLSVLHIGLVTFSSLIKTGCVCTCIILYGSGEIYNMRQ